VSGAARSALPTPAPGPGTRMRHEGRAAKGAVPKAYAF
jgi:hypothetical protein